VLIEQINDIRLEALERGFSDFFDVFRSAVQVTPPAIAIGSRLKPKFRGDYDLITEGSEGFANKFFVRERAVDFSGIKKRDAAFDGCANHCDPFLSVNRRTETEAHSHTAQSNGGDFQVAGSKFAFLHSSFLYPVV
jgi:hypothetical protein